MAQVVMRHLETNREARERRRETETIRGLAAFVEGKVSSRSRNAPKPRQFKPTNSKRIAKHASEGSLRNVGCENGSLDNTSSSQSHMQVVPPLIPVKDRHSLYGGINTPENPNSDEPGGLADTSDAKTLVAENRDTKLLADGSKSTPVPHQRSTGHEETFARAADLLDETLQLDGAGGVVYFDAADGLHLNVLDNDDPPTYRKESSFHDKQSESDFVFGSPSQSPSQGRFFGKRPNSTSSGSPARILACSMGRNTSFRRDDNPIAKTFIPLGEEVLAMLIQRYPRGKL
ncbi:hypothetical protein LTR66_007854 [Elasticomyces elasticus]|nr:hypothetical protein LTR66_007854 [Elasticomyces elasticus]